MPLFDAGRAETASVIALGAQPSVGHRAAHSPCVTVRHRPHSTRGTPRSSWHTAQRSLAPARDLTLSATRPS